MCFEKENNIANENVKQVFFRMVVSDVSLELNQSFQIKSQFESLIKNASCLGGSGSGLASGDPFLCQITGLAQAFDTGMLLSRR